MYLFSGIWKYCQKCDSGKDCDLLYPESVTTKQEKRNLRDKAKPYFVKEDQLWYWRSQEMADAKSQMHGKRQRKTRPNEKKRPGKAFVATQPVRAVGTSIFHLINT